MSDHAAPAHGHGHDEKKHDAGHAAPDAHAHGEKKAEGGGGHDEHGGGHGGPAKAIGLTMGLIGAMLAICAALVGSQRTELIAARVDQSTKLGLYMAETTKFRVMDSDLELLHAVTPSKTEGAKFEAALKNVRSHSGKADDEDTSELKDLLDVSTRSTADLLTPDQDDEAHFQSIRTSFKRDVAEAKEDAEAYDSVIEAHEKGAEGFERAQVMAEFGIVTAAVALLSGSRAVWIVSMLIGLLGAGQLGRTYVQTNEAIAAGEAKIAAAKTSSAKMEEDDDPGAEAPKGAPAPPKKE